MQRCPICSSEVPPSPRYPNYVCIACSKTATSPDGRLVEFWDYPDFGGLYVGTRELYGSEECYVGGVRCYAAIAYMGGTVIRPVPQAESEIAATLSKLRSECELCGAWSHFTGKTQAEGGRTYVLVRCPNGDGEFPVWKRDNEALVVAFERARATVTDSEAYQSAFAVLVGADAAAVAALVTAPPAELPLFAIEDVPLAREHALRWSDLVLEWPGWRPLPNRAVRVEEALATALKYGERTCVDRVIAWARPNEIAAVLGKLERRFRDKDPSVLAAAVRGARQDMGNG